jgi:putative ABC transport system permease protein
MRRLREWISRINGLFNKQRKDHQLDDEIESHLQLNVDDNLRLGMKFEEARRQAMIKLGGIESMKEAYREQRGLPRIETFWQDIRFGARQLRKNPGFTSAAVLTLALGIGATTAIFSLINAVLLEPLPYEQSGQLVNLWEMRPDGKSGDVSPGAFMDWREYGVSFEGVSSVRDAAANLTGIGQPERVNGLRVSVNFLSILHERLQVGRGFLPEEESVEGGEKVVVLSYGLWQRRFGGDTNLVGSLIQLDGESYVVTGVLRANALATEPQADFLIPSGWRRHYGANNLRVIARLKSGVTSEHARVELAALKQRMHQNYPEYKEKWSVTVTPMHEEVIGEVKPTLLILLGAVGCVLLVVCANVANLLLSRAVVRQREMAVRAALGASRWRTIRQVLTESVLLAALGGTLGVLIAYGGVHTLLAWSEGPVHHLAEAHVNARMLGFALCIALGTGLCFGVFPAFQISSFRLDPVLRESGRGLVAGSRGRLQSALIIGEIGLALMLLTGAGLLVRSFTKLMSVSPGFVAQSALAMDISMPDTKYPEPGIQTTFAQRMVDRISAIPGVESAGFAWNRPMQGFELDERSMRVVGRQNQPERGYSVKYEGVVGDYFRALGIPFLKGRTFLRSDNSTNAPPVVVCSEALARRIFQEDDPIGRFVQFDDDAKQFEIVGMVGDVKLTRITDDRTDKIYFPQGGNGSLIVRTRAAPLPMVGQIRQAVLEVDGDQPVSNVRTLKQDITRSVETRQQTLTLLSLFAAVSLGLAALGLYGVLAHGVALRRQEIGIRVALGAQRKDILRLILQNGMKLTLVGVGLGLIGAFALTRFLRNQLYQVAATDPGTFAAVALLLGLVAFLACVIPARRAAKVDPMVALRCE